MKIFRFIIAILTMITFPSVAIAAMTSSMVANPYALGVVIGINLVAICIFLTDSFQMGDNK